MQYASLDNEISPEMMKLEKKSQITITYWTSSLFGSTIKNLLREENQFLVCKIFILSPLGLCHPGRRHHSSPSPPQLRPTLHWTHTKMNRILTTIFEGEPKWAPGGSGSPHYWTSRTYSDTSHSVGLLWTSDQPDAETSTWQHTTLTTDGHSCSRRDSNPQSQHARPTP